MILFAKAPAFILASALSCTAPPQAPVVTIKFDNQQHKLNNSITQSELQQVHSDTTFSKTSSETFMTVGTAVSGISAALNIEFKMLTNPASNTTCMWPATAEILVTYSPQILIVRDYDPSSCRYRITYEHELRHVNTDIITINEFLPVIQGAIQIRTSQIGVVGPFDSGLTERQQQSMHSQLQDTLQLALDRMMTTRQQRQQLIDTRAEYLRLSKSCPGETTIPGMR